MPKALRIAAVFVAFIVPSSILTASDIGLTFWIDQVQMPLSTCMSRAHQAIVGAGLFEKQSSDWWVYGMADGKTAYVSCQANGPSEVLFNVTVSSLPGTNTVAALNTIVALMKDPNAARSPSPVGSVNAPGIAWWTDLRAYDIAECRRRAELSMRGAGLRITASDSWWVTGENSSLDSYVTCNVHQTNTMMNVTVAGAPGIDLTTPLNTLTGYMNNPDAIPSTPPGSTDRSGSRVMSLGGAGDPPGASDEPTIGPPVRTDMTGWSVDHGGSVVKPGEIHASPAADGKTSYFVAPQGMLGSWQGKTELYFEKMSWGGSYYGPDNYGAYGDVVLRNGSMSVRFDIDQDHSKSWRRYSVPLRGSGWRLSGGANSLDDVLANVTEFKIRAEYGAGTDYSALRAVSLDGGATTSGATTTGGDLDSAISALIPLFKELAGRAGATENSGMRAQVNEQMVGLLSGPVEQRAESALNLAFLVEMSPRVLPALLGEIEYGDPTVRQAALVGLIESLRPEDGVAVPRVLIDVLDATIPQLRTRAARLMGLVDVDPSVLREAAAALDRAAQDSDPRVQRAAQQSKTTLASRPPGSGKKIVSLSGPPSGSTGAGATGPSGLAGDMSVLTEERTASADCKGAAMGNDYRDVRFTLASPTVVRVLAIDPPGKASWWIQQKDYNGPLLANVANGAPVVVPAGSDLAKGFIPLPAGTFIFHVDCASSGVDRITAKILLPPMPSPIGPRYLVSAKAENDRIFYLSQAQQVKFVDSPPTGSIIDFPGSVLWSRDAGKLEAWSTRDLLPSGYCLHGEWPDGPDRTFAVEIIGPPQPTGQTTLRATASANPNGVEQSKGVQFTLTQAQVVNVRGARTAWIIDTAGDMWFNIVDGELQSGSSWVQSTGRSGEASGVSLPGVLLPPGSYHFAVSSTSGSAAGEVSFVGRQDSTFAWPPMQKHPCYPALHDKIKLPKHTATTETHGGIPEAIRECWPRERVELVKHNVGDEDGLVEYETHIGQMESDQSHEILWIEVITNPAKIRDSIDTAKWEVEVGNWTTQNVSGLTAYMRPVEGAIYISGLGQSDGPLSVQQKFEFHCGKLAVSGSSGKFTGSRWKRYPEGGIQGAVSDAEKSQFASAVQDQTRTLMQNIIKNLKARGLCSN